MIDLASCRFKNILSTPLLRFKLTKVTLKTDEEIHEKYTKFRVRQRGQDQFFDSYIEYGYSNDIFQWTWTVFLFLIHDSLFRCRIYYKQKDDVLLKLNSSIILDTYLYLTAFNW